MRTHPLTSITAWCLLSVVGTLGACAPASEHPAASKPAPTPATTTAPVTETTMNTNPASSPVPKPASTDKMAPTAAPGRAKTFTDAELKARLTPEQYRVTQLKATERPFTGKYVENTDQGVYRCSVCNEPLFESGSKFNSHCGWPSFDREIGGRGNKIEYIEDDTHGMVRTEIVCKTCGAHLGHVFDDGPTDTGERFCVNSASIELEKK